MALTELISNLNLRHPAPVSVAPAINDLGDHLGNVIQAMVQRRHQEEQLQLEQQRLEAQKAQWDAQARFAERQFEDEQARAYEAQKEKMYPRWEKAVDAALAGDKDAAMREFPEDGSGFRVEMTMPDPPPQWEQLPMKELPAAPSTGLPEGAFGPPRPEDYAQYKAGTEARAAAEEENAKTAAENERRRAKWEALNADPERRYPANMTLYGRHGEVLGRMNLAETRRNYHNMVSQIRAERGGTLPAEVTAARGSGVTGVGEIWQAAKSMALEELGNKPALSAQYRNPEGLRKAVDERAMDLWRTLMAGRNTDIMSSTSKENARRRPSPYDIPRDPDVQGERVASNVRRAREDFEKANRIPEIRDGMRSAENAIRLFSSATISNDEAKASAADLAAKMDFIRAIQPGDPRISNQDYQYLTQSGGFIDKINNYISQFVSGRRTDKSISGFRAVVQDGLDRMRRVLNVAASAFEDRVAKDPLPGFDPDAWMKNGAREIANISPSYKSQWMSQQLGTPWAGPVSRLGASLPRTRSGSTPAVPAPAPAPGAPAADPVDPGLARARRLEELRRQQQGGR